MCPVVLLALGLTFLLLLLELSAAISVTFNPSKIDLLKQDDFQLVSFSINDTSSREDKLYQLIPDDASIADVMNGTIRYNSSLYPSGFLNGSCLIEGKFLGYTRIRVRTEEGSSSDSLLVSVVRKKGALSTAFTTSVAVLVSLNYINMGCALDLMVVKRVLMKPIGPAVGFVSQYVAMPLFAFGLAKLLFSNPIMQLGLFTFGCSPGGGASNMWTVILKGNLDLSLTMTFISTATALGMMPLWLFTLGTTLFEDLKRKLPFFNIIMLLVSMVIPLGIGLLFQRFLPRVAKFCKKSLSIISVLMILFIIVFGTYANLYMFRLFTWQVIVAAMGNVWLGFLFGGLSAKVIGLPIKDIIAISIETGIQNSGIAIVLLGFSLPKPDSDIASVIPVAGSIMTAFPLLIIAGIQKLWTWKRSKKESGSFVLDDGAHDHMLKSPSGVSNSSDVKPSSNGYV